MNRLHGVKIPRCGAEIDEGVAEMRQYVRERFEKLGLPQYGETTEIEAMRSWFNDFARVAMDEIHNLQTRLTGQEAIVRSLNDVVRGLCRPTFMPPIK